MSGDQALIFAILAGTMGLFLWGRLRHDIVALCSLLAAVLAGLVPAGDAFAGFSQPAVITVACVLVLSRALQIRGAVDILAGAVLPAQGGIVASLSALLGLGAVLSAFMNNVGAMALLMPVAVRLAQRVGLAPGQVLMPLAFATMLGGMVTLIGTPPNLIVSGLREEAGYGEFAMFDFARVGIAVALAGVAMLALFVWRIVPARAAAGAEEFAAGAYFTEVRVPAGSALVGRSLAEAEDKLSRSGAQIVGLVRGEMHLSAPRVSRLIAADDILVLEAELDALQESLSKLGLEMEENRPEDAAEAAEAVAAAAEDRDAAAQPRPGDVEIREYVVRPGSPLVGRSPVDLGMRTRLGVNLLAVSRAGRQRTTRLRELRLASGDLLLVQGPADALAEFVAETASVPLAGRGVTLPDRGRAALATAIMAAVVVASATGLVATPVAFAAGVVASVILKTLPLRQLYDAVDWPVIVLLGALMPVAAAMETTGAAGLLAGTLVDRLAGGSSLVALALVLVATMTLSDVMNNAATAAVMCPIALGIAATLGANPDSFLMAVAIGASCAFLTPIGHQNNTLILGAGGFRFGDYWRPGLVLEIIVVVVAMLLLPVFWPL